MIMLWRLVVLDGYFRVLKLKTSPSALASLPVIRMGYKWGLVIAMKDI